MQLDIYGPYRGLTGYDEVCRNIIFRLHQRGIRTHITEFQGWSGTTILDTSLFKVLENQTITPDWRLSFCLIPQVPYYPHLNACFTMFEATKIPQEWVDKSQLLDAVIVPTQFCKEVFEQCGVWNVKVVPLGVNTKLFHSNVEPLALQNEIGSPMDFDLRFLYVCERSARKNIEGLLRAWCIGTSKQTDRCLILKTSSFSEARLRGLVTLIRQLKKEYGGAPIFIYSKWLHSEKVPQLFASCTHYISASRGEGWDLCAHQAAVMGKNVIVPAHTSYLEYLKDYAQFVSVKRAPCDQTGVTRKLYLNAEWFEPNEEEMIAAICEAKNTDKPNEDALVEVRKLDWHNTVQKLLEALNEKPLIVHPEAEEYESVVVCKSVGRRCGIADYTTSLVKALNPASLISGDDKGYLSSFYHARRKYATVHIQLEYQFHTPVRLRYLFDGFGSHSKIVVTMHTVNPAAAEHNKILKEADQIIVLTETQKTVLLGLGFQEEKVTVIPLGCDAHKVSLQKQFVLGTFGFCYFHKGLHKLLSLLDVAFTDYNLLALSHKPEQDNTGYFDFCRTLLTPEIQPRVAWAQSYMKAQESWSLLNQCELIVLPYDEWGGYAASASARFCLTAGRPLLVSNTNFFDDLPDSVAMRYDKDEDLVEVIPKAVKWAKGVSDTTVWDYCDKWNWKRIAELHREVYSRL